MANTPPTGTVTFLFTDVEGSTALWENYPARMPQVVERHDQILRKHVEDHGGYVFKMVGDACCAAFAYPREALKAALAAQRALFAERWGGAISLRVRMALHTGFAEQERDGDYFGPAVNRVARVLSAGHGGQVLLSGATYNLVRDHPDLIDEGARLTDLGEHRLKDLTHPERIHQLSVPDLPGVFPPLRADRAPDDFDERYRFKRFLGSGGMAKVYLAHDELLDRDVAIKVLHPRHVEEQEFVERFKREARSAAKLSHPNIVPVHDWGQKEDGTYWMVMEHLPGGTLKDLILKEDPLSPRAALELTLQVAEALEEAHEKGVVHRDIKPQNVLLTHRGLAKVADFGIARAASATTLTRTGGVMGTPHYISPEQAEGHPASPKSDLYALGVVLYEMLTQKLPYDADTPVAIIGKQLRGDLSSPRDINPNVPERVEAITLKLLARDPEDRYRDASALVGDLKRVLRSLEQEDEDDYGRVIGPDPADTMVGPNPADTILDDTETSAARVPAEDRGTEDDAAEATIAEAAVTTSTVEVPTLTGKDAFQASATLADRGLTLGDQKEVPSETVPEGEIMEQAPEAGTEVDSNTLVSVAVSSGLPTTVAVPDLSGHALSQVRSKLAAAGLSLGGKDEAPSDGWYTGRVMKQNPAAGTEVQAGSSVSIMIGSGPEKLTTTSNETAPPHNSSPPHQDGEKRRRKILPWVMVATVTVLALIGVVVWSLVDSTNRDTDASKETPAAQEPSETKTDKVSVPDVRGETQQDAEAELRSLGFEVEAQAKKRTKSERIAEGRVIDQFPNTPQQKGDTVTIFVGE